MCILLVAHQSHPVYDLVVAANRDEFHDRPSAPAGFWEDHPNLLAGRDLEAGGTWLGVNRAGRFSAVTNLRGGVAHDPASSRGHLVRDFLLDSAPASQDFLSALASQRTRYAGCNLLLAEGELLHWWSPGGERALSPGIYGISNTPLDEDWPKVGRLKRSFLPLGGAQGETLVNALLELLRDRAVSSPDGQAQDLPPARLEETIFVHTPSYGTRCSSIVLRDRRLGRLIFMERRYDANAAVAGEIWQEFELIS